MSHNIKSSWVVSAIVGASVSSAIFWTRKKDEKPPDQANASPGTWTEADPTRASLTSPGEAEQLRLRMSSAFATSYLTLISIIQGVVVALTVNSWLTDSSHSMAAILRLIFSISIAVFLWHHYMMGVAGFFWLPHIYDTVIPLGLGVSQFFLGRNIESDHDSWYVWGGVVSLAGGAALVNMFGNASRTHESRFAYDSVGVMTHMLEGSVIVAAGVFFILAFWPNRNEYVGVIVALVMAGIFGLASLIYWGRLTRAAVN